MINVNMTDKVGVTLATAGKYCADNVKVTPSADILRKDEQAKTATPTTSAQDITPDAGKALSKVTVNPITAAIVGDLDADSFASSIVAAIEGKGVDVPSGAKLSALAALIESIEAGGGGATEPYIEEVYDSSNYLIEATMHGYTKIRDFAFYSCTKLSLISLPSGLTSIKSNAFYNCIKLSLTSLPSGVTSIGKSAFEYCTSLSLTSLPSGLTSIGGRAFYNCTSLSLTSLPSGLTSIGDRAFHGCINLVSLTFEGKPTTISNSAFNGCTNLTTINVPWAEGEVANAPWGATNATINYNYTGGAA